MFVAVHASSHSKCTKYWPIHSTLWDRMIYCTSSMIWKLPSFLSGRKVYCTIHFWRIHNDGCTAMYYLKYATRTSNSINSVEKEQEKMTLPKMESYIPPPPVHLILVKKYFCKNSQKNNNLFHSSFFVGGIIHLCKNRIMFLEPKMQREILWNQTIMDPNK